MSDFHVEVVRVGKIERHPNADTLGITEAAGAPVIVKLGEFAEGQLAVYVPVDAVMPDTERWAFLGPKERIKGDPVPAKYRRIKAKKLRGVFSMGMLVPISDVPLGPHSVGTNVQMNLGITKWEPNEEAASGPRVRRRDTRPWYQKMVDPTWWRRRWTRFLTRHTLASEQVDGPAGFDRYTDIEPLRRNSNALVEGEEVVLTEKIHGANARFGVDDAGNFWVGSHNNWLSRPGKLAPKNWWWAAALQEGLEERLKAWKGFVFYGEVYGPGVQKGFPYDEASNTHISVRFFDIKNTQTGRFMSHDEMWQTMGELNLAVVPMLYRGPWKKELRAAAEGKSVLADHLREGFVVRPAHERVELGLGRVVLKHVGEGYHLARAKEHE